MATLQDLYSGRSLAELDRERKLALLRGYKPPQAPAGDYRMGPALAEGGASLLSNMALGVPALGYGLYKGATGGWDQLPGAMEQVQDYAYKPKTAGGQAVADIGGKLMEMADPVTPAVGWAAEQLGASPTQQTLAELAAGAVMPGVSPKRDIYPGQRPGAEQVRQEVLAKREREADPSRKRPREPRWEEQMSDRAKDYQVQIDIGKRLDAPAPRLDLTGYDLFDYSKLGEGVGEEYSLVRPGPAQNKFSRLPERIQMMVTDPYVYQGTKKAVERGKDFWNWYDTRPYLEALLNEGMSPEGLERYVRYQQAAAQNVRPNVQQRIANYLWSRDQAGTLTPNDKRHFPPGYGSKSQKQIWENAVDIRAGKPIDTEKLASYGENFGVRADPLARLQQQALILNWAPATMDTHGVRLPAMLSHNPAFIQQGVRENRTAGGLADFARWENARIAGDKDQYVDYSPRETYAAGRYPMEEALQRPGHFYGAPGGSDYAAIEQYLYKPIASELGIAPAAAQAGAWVGGGEITGLKSPPKAMLQLYEDEIKRLAERNNMTPAQAIRAIAQGKIY